MGSIPIHFRLLISQGLRSKKLSGGLPGLEAINEVQIERGSWTEDSTAARQIPQALPANHGTQAALDQSGRFVRIPLRARPGELPSIRPEDIILRTGDIVFIEARTGEFFYTDGILPAGEHVVPRDYDLHVVDAVARVGGPIVNSGVNPNNIQGMVLGTGFGFPSPSLLTVVRRVPGGGQVPILVDLNRALRNPHENILVQPGDVLILQEKPSEALARYITESVLHFNLVWQLIHGPHETGTTTVSLP